MRIKENNAAPHPVQFSQLPDTVNYHFTAACEMGCKHCFAVFADCTAKRLEERKAVVRAIAAYSAAGDPCVEPRRLNFVGGEPTLHPHFEPLVDLARGLGLQTSVVTNGYSLIWKVFQAMAVDGQNDKGREQWQVSRDEYDGFIQRHAEAGAIADAEPEDLMRASYAMIAPDGRFFDSASGRHRYSDPIIEVGVNAAWQQIHFDPKRFSERTKHYSSGSIGGILQVKTA